MGYDLYEKSPSSDQIKAKTGEERTGSRSS